MNNYDQVCRSGNHLVDRRDDEDVTNGRDYCFECCNSPCCCEENKRIRQEELEAYCPTFEMFLMQEWSKSVLCTENDCLDDEMEDVCERWINSLSSEEVQKYCEEYGKHCFRKGQKVGK